MDEIGPQLQPARLAFASRAMPTPGEGRECDRACQSGGDEGRTGLPAIEGDGEQKNEERDEARLQRRSHGRAVEQLCDHGKIRLGERQPGHGRCLQREPQRRQQEGETGETGHHCYHRQMPLYHPAAAGRIEREQRQAEQQAEIDVERPADGDECHVVHGVT